jgi:hypothetical protein
MLLDTVLRVDVAQETSYTGTDTMYYIRTVSVSTNIATTTVTGEAYKNERITLRSPTKLFFRPRMDDLGFSHRQDGDRRSRWERFEPRGFLERSFPRPYFGLGEHYWVKNSKAIKDFSVATFSNTDPYTASWWETWGPTIIEFVLILLLDSSSSACSIPPSTAPTVRRWISTNPPLGAKMPRRFVSPMSRAAMKRKPKWSKWSNISKSRRNIPNMALASERRLAHRQSGHRQNLA